VSLAVYYGGTFDPVHEGHMAVARAARDALAATVYLVPAADPPHKGPTHADAEQRARMLDIAIAGERGLRVDRRELHRDGPSYTVDTLTQVRAELGPQAPLAWLVGGDSLDTLHTWHRWRELFELAHIVAVQRPGSHVDAASLAHASPLVHDEVRGRWRSLAALGDAPAGGLAVLPLHELRPESSSELRRRIAAGEPWRDWVPGPVAGYIELTGLYAGGVA
jgi:nicotinate-nucleotide adenylyltransferase